MISFVFVGCIPQKLLVVPIFVSQVALEDAWTTSLGKKQRLQLTSLG